jgi:hypothetical protein
VLAGSETQVVSMTGLVQTSREGDRKIDISMHQWRLVELFEGGLNICIPNPCRVVWGHPPPQGFFVIFTNKQSILVPSDKIVKAKNEHLLTKTNGAREISFKLIFCLVEISNIKSADTSTTTLNYTQGNSLSLSLCE